MHTFRFLNIAAGLLLSGAATAQNGATKPMSCNSRPTVTGSSALVSTGYYPWDRIAEKDILWKKRVWRDIDVNDEKNAAFRQAPGGPVSGVLVNVLADEVRAGNIKAYSAADDRFTNVLNQQEFSDVVAAVTSGSQQVHKYRIKEDWLYRNENEQDGYMTVRILGIAPLADVTAADGSVSLVPLFWVYYPDSRSQLALHETGNAGNGQEHQTWNDLFEGRAFSSSINKITESHKTK